MRFFGRAIESITELDLQALIDNQEPEAKVIDYKRELKIQSGDEKKDFLHDVTSFANTAGGHLLFGVRADGLYPKELVGLDVSLDDHDPMKQKIDNMVRDSVEPRLPTFQVHFVPLSNGRFVLVLRIEQSWAGPHMVQTSSKFYARNSSGNFQLDVQQLRAHFAATADLGKSMGAFRTERVGKVIANEAPVPLVPGAKIIIHILPQRAFVLGASVDLNKLAFTPIVGPSVTIPNFEGTIAYPRTTVEGDSASYAQAFRNGCVEAVDALLLAPFGTPPNTKWIRSSDVEAKAIRWVTNALQALLRSGSAPPWFACITFVGVRDYRLVAPEQWRREDPGVVLRRQALALPEVLFEDCCDDKHVARSLWPAFNVLWNAFGWDGSRNFDETGRKFQ